jgi:hypothetical protein
MSFENDLPGRLISATFDNQLFVLLNDDEASYEKRRNKLPLDQLTSAKDATLLEFKPDGSEKPRRVLSEGSGQGCFIPSSEWRLSPSAIVTLGASGFAAKSTFPVMIQFSKEAQK